MKDYFQRTTSAAPLAVFRIALGLLLFGSIVRFWAKGWIHELYIEPRHFFPFYGFGFVRPLGEYTYLLFAVCAICALMVAAGFFYRYASAGLFLIFTYIELIDKSTYLNHYYFISMVSLMMVFLPAHVYFSIDAWRNRKILSNRIPQWSLDSLKLFVCMVYFFAGLAKINSDWLLHAQPLRIWLPAKNDLPIIGSLFNHEWVAYAFSWAGCLYDLSIPFLLLSPRTRLFGYAAVVIFHVLTAILFPIGMFPYIMMATALIFFSAEFHQRILSRIGRWLKTNTAFIHPDNVRSASISSGQILPIAFGIFLLIQAAMPFRYTLYPDELFWAEEGYRFSWRVMLMEKAGYEQFTVKDAEGKHAIVDNREFLTPLQEKMMSTQPDMILQYAHMLRDHYAAAGFRSPEVYVDSYVALNGRLGKPMVHERTDLSKEKESFSHKPWILPFGNEIKGI
ncbi:MAG: HTTM domain-containing protein [Chryseosolibacter sp.]